MVLLYRSQDLVFPTSQVSKRTEFPQPVLRGWSLVDPAGTQPSEDWFQQRLYGVCVLGEWGKKTSCRSEIKACYLTRLQMHSEF